MSESAAWPVAAWGVVADYRYGSAAQWLATLPDFAGNVTEDYPIGGSYVERTVAVSATVVAVGGATTRFLVVELLDQSGVPVAASQSPYGTTAGHTSRQTLTVNAQQGGAQDAAAIIGSLPGIFMQPSYALRLSVLGGVAADTISDIRILTDRFSTAPQEFPPGQGPG